MASEEAAGATISTSSCLSFQAKPPSSLGGVDRLLALLTGTPCHGALAAERLGRIAAFDLGHLAPDVATKLQVDLIRRIVGYLRSDRWETRVSASSALEQVCKAMAPAQLLHHVLLGAAPESVEELVGRGKPGLLDLDNMDLEGILDRGEPLVAADTWNLEHINRGGIASSSPTGEELQRQKREILKRLGMEAADPQSTGTFSTIEDFGIKDEDLTQSGVQEAQAGRGESRKRKLEELGLVGQQPSLLSSSSSSNNNSSVTTSGKEAIIVLGEELGMQLFHSAWEVRHGAVLGLQGVVKALMAMRPETPWPGPVKLWAKDFLARSICLLALDRFGDYSTGSLIAPVRETAAQLLALLLDSTCWWESQDATVVNRVLPLLLTVLAKYPIWDVRHGGFLGLKYLMVTCQQSLPLGMAEDIVKHACTALSDTADCVCDAAATCILSLLLSSSQAEREAYATRAIDPTLCALLQADQVSLHLLALLKLAKQCLEGAGAEQAGATWGLPVQWDLAKVLFHLWHLSFGACGAEVRVLACEALCLLCEKVKAVPSLAQGSQVRQVVRGIMWRVFEQLVSNAISPSPRLLEALCHVWRATVSLACHAYELAQDKDWQQLFVQHSFVPSADYHDGLMEACKVEEMRARELLILSADDATRGSCLWPSTCELCSRRTGRWSFEAYYESQRQAARALAVLHVCCARVSGPTTYVLSRAIQELRVSFWASVKESVCLFYLELLLLSGSEGGEGPFEEPMSEIKKIVESTCTGGSKSSRLVVYNELQPYVEALLQEPENGEEHPPSILWDRILESLSPAEVHNVQERDRQLRRGLGTAAASCIVAYFPRSPSKLNPVICSLMEVIKHEEGQGRVGLAVHSLILLLAFLTTSSDYQSPQEARWRSSGQKLVTNLCLLSCAKKNQALPTAKAAARDALREMSREFGGNLFQRLPWLWDIVAVIETWGAGSECVGFDMEGALRVLIVLAPQLTGGSLDKALSLTESLLCRVVSMEPMPTKLVSALSARCLALLIRREGQELLAPCRGVSLVGARLLNVLSEHQGPSGDARRIPSAGCLLEVVKAIIVDGWGSKARLCLAYLLPAALRTLSDQVEEVRVPGTEAFRMLMELAPLLTMKDWKVLSSSPSSSYAGRARPQDDVVRLILGEPLGVFKTPPMMLSMMKGELQLRPYQWDGVRWLTILRHAGLNGVLCDEMGLGKTLQTLCALLIQKSEGGFLNPSLIVCPASVAGHWLHETKRFFTEEALIPLLYVDQASAVEVRERWIDQLHPSSLVIISYSLMRRDIIFLKQRAWNYVVFDEGHLLRNPHSAVSQAASRLRSSHRLILTGTPVQNEVHDLWALVDLLVPGLLGHKQQFDKEYGRPIGRATLKNASLAATAEALQKLDQLHAHLLPFILRREKAQVLRDLPPKIVTDIFCELSPLQVEMYASYTKSSEVRSALGDLQRMLGDDTASAHSVQPQPLGAQALRLLHHLRLVCVHPALAMHSSPTERQELLTRAFCSGKMVALQELLFSCGILADLGRNGDNDSSCGGWVESEQDTEESEKDTGGPLTSTGEMNMASETGPCGMFGSEELHRCLIFAQHQVTLDAIELSILNKAKARQAYGGYDDGEPIRFLRLDGNVPPSRREDLVQQFNRDTSIPVMLLTSKVGGLGLNLTGADTVIFVEHDWNPMVDAQAMDRAHRIGQGRTVNVYRIITKGTVEEEVMKLQGVKKRIAEALVTDSNASGDFSQLERMLDAVVGASAQQPSQGHNTVDPTRVHKEKSWDDSQYDAFQIETLLNVPSASQYPARNTSSEHTA